MRVVLEYSWERFSVNMINRLFSQLIGLKFLADEGRIIARNRVKASGETGEFSKV